MACKLAKYVLGTYMCTNNEVAHHMLYIIHISKGFFIQFATIKSSIIAESAIQVQRFTYCRNNKPRDNAW